jgi:signal transduction histidine kinase
MVKLDDGTQVLFLFKEVSIYHKLSRAKTTEKFTNLLINSIAHNFFTPLNALIQLNKSLEDMIGCNQMDTAEKNIQMIGVCLQQLVFTTNNIIEMSKIRQNRFKSNIKSVDVMEKIESIFDFFRSDMNFRELQYEVKIKDPVDSRTVLIDEPRFGIVLYNLISNAVKFTSGGLIKLSVKLCDATQLNLERKVSK